MEQCPGPAGPVQASLKAGDCPKTVRNGRN